MRYKHSSDVERVIESINNYSYGRVKQSLLKKIKTSMKKTSLSLTTNHFNPTDKACEIEKLDDFSKLKGETQKSVMLNTVRSPRHFGAKFDKSEARSVLKELHNKTHFKAATDFTNFNSIFLIYFKKSADIHI